jgi:hypothetical protein
MNEITMERTTAGGGVRLKRVGGPAPMSRNTAARASIDSDPGAKFAAVSYHADNRQISDGRNAKGDEPQNEARRRGRPKKVAIGDVAVQSPKRTAKSAYHEQSTADDDSIRGGTADSRSRASEQAVQKAQSVFAAIGERFNQNRKKSKASAYEQYQRDLMENMDTLVLGDVISLKDITATITDLESFMRDNTSDQGKSQAQLLAEWLSLPIEQIDLSSGATEETE